MVSSEHATRWLAGDVAQELGRLAEGGSNLDQLGGGGAAVAATPDPGPARWTARRSRRVDRAAALKTSCEMRSKLLSITASWLFG